MLVKLSAAIFVSASSFLATVNAAVPQHKPAPIGLLARVDSCHQWLGYLSEKLESGLRGRPVWTDLATPFTNPPPFYVVSGLECAYHDFWDLL
jgi:hypothetical protein